MISCNSCESSARPPNQSVVFPNLVLGRNIRRSEDPYSRSSCGSSITGAFVQPLAADYSCDAAHAVAFTTFPRR